MYKYGVTRHGSWVCQNNAWLMVLERLYLTVPRFAVIMQFTGLDLMIQWYFCLGKVVRIFETLSD
jgi:hypothetical protein